MGNTITKDNDTINWNNLKTDNFSDSLNNKYLSNDSKLLLSKLDINLSNIPNNETDSIDNIFSKYQSQSQLISNDFNTTTSLDNKNSEQLSETSPFISSEMYNYLVKKNQLGSNNKQIGGNNKQRGGALNNNNDNDSSTSETSESDSDSESNKPKSKKPESKKPESKKPESKKPESKKPESKKTESKKPESKKPESKKPDSDFESDPESDPDSNPEEPEPKYNSKYSISNSEELSKDSISNNENLSYISSPGNSLDSANSDSEKLSGGSISNNNDYVPPSSINTSDINMVSEAS